METQAGVPIPLNPPFYKDKKVGPHGLGASVATPDAAGGGGEEEEAKPRHHEKPCDEIELVGPDFDPEEEEPTIRHVDEHRLIGEREATVPPDPRGNVVNPKGDDHNQPFEITELSRHAARENRLPRGIEGGRCFRGRGHGFTPEK